MKNNIWKAQSGRTLVEVMVSLAIGILILGAVLLTISQTGVTGRKQDAHARLAEEGQVALGIVAGQLRMAGYSVPRVNNPPGAPTTHYVGPPVRGCDTGFASNGAADLSALTCAASGGTAAVSVVYEADASNTVPTSGGVPTDCLGQALQTPATSSLGGTYLLAENRFYIQVNPQTGNPTLYCIGNGGATPFAAGQPLVDNVEDLELAYGISATGTDSLGNVVYLGNAVRYLSAATLDTSMAANPNRWRLVTSVRVCMLMRTEDNAADAPVPYNDCSGTLVTPTDRRIRRAVISTVSLRNRSTVGTSPTPV